MSVVTKIYALFTVIAVAIVYLAIVQPSAMVVMGLTWLLMASLSILFVYVAYKTHKGKKV